MHIHWYPGHIAKAERQLKEKLNLVDVVIEVRDARIPLSSSYTNIKKLLGEKPRLLLLNKADLVDKEELKKVYNYTLEKQYFVNNLVNNAGFGDRCDFKDMDIDKQMKLIVMQYYILLGYF